MERNFYAHLLQSNLEARSMSQCPRAIALGVCLGGASWKCKQMQWTTRRNWIFEGRVPQGYPEANTQHEWMQSWGVDVFVTVGIVAPRDNGSAGGKLAQHT